VKQRGLAPGAVDMRASINPIGGFAAGGTAPGPWHVLSPIFSERVRDLAAQGFRGPFAVADGRVIHNAGGSEAQELAFALASAVEFLRALSANSVQLDAARGMIYFRLAADADEFLTIAKFRAIRKLWARVEEACGLAPKPAYVTAETAWRMMTRRDPYVNMLRTTIAVTAAGLGGADSILALPHTAALGLPDAFARRVARNTQLILLEESNLYRVADPAAGSGGIEELTGKLCATAWTQFQEIEKAGGVWKALETGLVQQ
jgi:methylmalonyl-CoA mutase